MAIEGPSKADINCVDNKDGTCSVSYMPTLPGDYNILVKYNDKHIAGSPFSARIIGQCPVPPTSRVPAEPRGLDMLKCFQRTTSGALRSNWARRRTSLWTSARRT